MHPGEWCCFVILVFHEDEEEDDEEENWEDQEQSILPLRMLFCTRLGLRARFDEHLFLPMLSYSGLG